MSDQEPQFDREGIYIDRELAESIAIEEELDANVVDAYVFPDPRRRRLSAWVFVTLGVLTPLVVNDGWLLAGAFLSLAGWHFLSAWPLAVDENQAMTTAGREVEFPVGHASAAVRFQGWRSRPRWSVVLYAASEPPDQRALVVVDAVDGRVVEEPFVESIAGV